MEQNTQTLDQKSHILALNHHDIAQDSSVYVDFDTLITWAKMVNPKNKDHIMLDISGNTYNAIVQKYHMQRTGPLIHCGYAGDKAAFQERGYIHDYIELRIFIPGYSPDPNQPNTYAIISHRKTWTEGGFV
jgi:hypothetical protein